MPTGLIITIVLEKKLVLGIMANFYRLIKTMSNFDTLTLAVDDDDINKLIIN